MLSAASARHLRIPYLFLAGLSEKSFPAADRADGVYSEAENQRFIEAGLPLPSRSDRQTDEMLLFYETITAATRRLYLSYPAIDDSGEPLTPSPYLKEVEQPFGHGTPIPRFAQIDLSPVPDEDGLCSSDAFRIRAVAEAMQGKADLLAGWEQGAGSHPRGAGGYPAGSGERLCAADTTLVDGGLRGGETTVFARENGGPARCAILSHPTVLPAPRSFAGWNSRSRGRVAIASARRKAC